MIEIKQMGSEWSIDNAINIAAQASRLSKRSKGDNGGPKDIALLSKLIKAGDEHGKSMRGVNIYLNINAPRYWWQEFVTYTIGSVQLGSESTMHDNIDMSIEELIKFKENLPEGTMQRRIFMINYQALRHMYKQRRFHRLPEWKEFCNVIESLPYAKELITVGIKED